MSFSAGFGQTFLYSFQKKNIYLFYRMTLNASFYLSKIWDPNYRISFEYIKIKEVNYCQNVALKIIPDNSEHGLLHLHGRTLRILKEKIVGQIFQF